MVYTTGPGAFISCILADLGRCVYKFEYRIHQWHDQLPWSRKSRPLLDPGIFGYLGRNYDAQLLGFTTTVPIL